MSDPVTPPATPKDPERLYYPREIKEEIGLGLHAINALKRKGCPFYGTRTTIKWVRDFLAREAGAIPPAAAQVSGEMYRSGHR